MTTEEQISKNQDERDEARQNLRDTLTEVNAKVERAGGDLRPSEIVRSHPLAAALAAGTLGLFFGSTIKTRQAGPIIVALLLGVVFATRSSNDGGERDARQANPAD
jgi:hypothetical protein